MYVLSDIPHTPLTHLRFMDLTTSCSLSLHHLLDSVFATSRSLTG